MNPFENTRWELDASKSTAEFRARTYWGLMGVGGCFGRLTGAVEPDGRLELVIDAASLDTGNRQRDRHLRSGDFFDVERHPQLTFVSTSTRAVADNAIDVTGQLTIRGVTREVTLAIRGISGPQLDMRGALRIGAVANTHIKRSDFDMTWNKALETGGVVVGDVVTITIDASLVQAS